MVLSAETIERLHRHYGRYVEHLRARIVRTNRSLGSSNPENTRLAILTKSEFERLLKEPTDDPEVIRLWLLRIIRGHEHEFPEVYQAASNSVRRATGT